MIRADEETPEFLEGIRRELADGDAGQGMHRLFRGLAELRARSPRDEWKGFLDRAHRHELLDLIHEDPMTRRSFEKPRGYAGDAVLLDYIYRHRGPRYASPLGRAVYDYAVGRPAACAVRHRRDWLGYCIDRAADEAGGSARILSVACGHLREAEVSAAISNGWLDELVALDSDAASLAMIENEGPRSVKPVELSVARLLSKRTDLGRFHLVYSAGLYDYLEEPLARKLTARLFDMLEPGGRLIFSNFLPTVADAGYMEVCMGWSLIYRDLEELEALAADVPKSDLISSRVYSDPYQAIGYIELERVGAP